MQAVLKGVAESIFHPPGCQPFPAPQSSAAYHYPSNFENLSEDIRKTILTPEKCRDFKIKDNESYTPLNYSFSEENYNLPVKLDDKKCATQEGDGWVSALLNEHWPSESSQQHLLDTNTISSPFENKSSSESSDRMSFPSSAPEQPQMSSTQTSLPLTGERSGTPSQNRSQSSQSNISLLMDRFRYGKPLPPNERKRLQSPPLAGKPPLSTETKRQELKSEEITSSKKADYDCSEASFQGNHSEEDSFTLLQRKVEQLLQESSTFQSQLSSTPPHLTATTDQGSLSDTRASTPGVQGDPTTSRYASVLSSSSSGITQPVREPNATPTNVERQSLPRTTHFSQPPTYSWKNAVKGVDIAPHPPPFETTTQTLPFKDDILQQWRLRRRMEQAKLSSDHHESAWKNFFGEASKRPVVSDTMRYAPAERPFHQAPPLMRPQTVAHPSVMEAPSDTRGVARAEPRKEIRSIGVSVVPTSCAETQTSPRTSVSDTPRRVSPVHRKESELSLQRVKVVNGRSDAETGQGRDPASPISAASSSGAWGGSVSMSGREDGGGDARPSRKSRRSASVSQKDNSSPTTAVVKKVVGSRLFNTSVTPDRTSATVSDAASAAGEPTAASSDGISTVGRPPAASSAALDRDRTASDAHASLDESRSTTEHFGKPGKVDGAEEQVGDESLQTPDDTGTSPVPSPECPVAIDDPQAVLEKLLESIEKEEHDFLDDPVMKSLREQRNKHLAELRYIDEELRKIAQTRENRSVQ